MHTPHRRIEASADTRIFHIKQHFEAVLRGEALHHLDAAAVAVHVAEAARIHQDVEAELLPSAESPQHLVILTTMAQPQIDDLAPTAFPRHLHRLPDLAVGMMAMLVEQCRRNLNFERLFVQQIDDRLEGAIGSPAIISFAAWRNSRRVSIS